MPDTPLTPGPRLRTDIVDVYVARRSGMFVEFLQLRRAQPPLAGTWHPIMGHVEAGERADATAWRELREEVGLAHDTPQLRCMWALEQVHPFYVRELDAILLSPRFVVEVDPDWSPILDAEAEPEHDAFRWMPDTRAADAFLWPGQVRAVEEAGRVLRGAASAELLRVPPPPGPSGAAQRRRPAP